MIDTEQHVSENKIIKHPSKSTPHSHTHRTITHHTHTSFIIKSYIIRHITKNVTHDMIHAHMMYTNSSSNFFFSYFITHVVMSIPLSSCIYCLYAAYAYHESCEHEMSFECMKLSEKCRQLMYQEISMSLPMTHPHSSFVQQQGIMNHEYWLKHLWNSVIDMKPHVDIYIDVDANANVDGMRMC